MTWHARPMSAEDQENQQGEPGFFAPFKATPTIYTLGLPLFVILFDQVTKYAATRAFNQPMSVCASNPDISVTREISPVVDLSLICNEGISWNLLQGASDVKRWGLLAVAIIMVGVLYSVLASSQDRFSRFSVALLIGGAIGNAIDRALFGAVTDFVNASDIGFHYIFNVADSAITIGIICLIISFFREWRAEKQAAQ